MDFTGILLFVKRILCKDYLKWVIGDTAKDVNVEKTSTLDFSFSRKSGNAQMDGNCEYSNPFGDY